MLTDEAWIRGEIACCDSYPNEHGRLMKATLLELLARRNVMRCEDELTRIELAGEVDPVDAWDALEKARTELDEVTR